ncbi:hypothetical protein [Microbispora sp. H10885]|uniref:hypothetical protein n=1 Tax=Microbispora sp. H10885 TaxID=2729110 RepID=UPI002175CEBA|nr:hypothetical protein [Microbispora sp. H10885]
MANRAIDPFLANVAPDLLRPPIDMVRLGLDPRGFAPQIVNLAEVRSLLRTRIARQLATAPDPELTADAESAAYFTMSDVGADARSRTDLPTA